MKFIVILLFPLQVLAQVQNCQMECPSQDRNNVEDSSYQQYRERQACLSACEQSNRQERRIQAQEEDLQRQKEEIDKQRLQLEEQQTTLRQIQQQVNDLETNQ